MEPAIRSRLTTGAMLILLGLALFGMQYIGDVGDSVVLLASGVLFILGAIGRKRKPKAEPQGDRG